MDTNTILLGIIAAASVVTAISTAITASKSPGGNDTGDKGTA